MDQPETPLPAAEPLQRPRSAKATRYALVQAGMEIRLDLELGRGGEGTVFAIAGRADRVAKIYARLPDERKVRKLQAMAASAAPALLRIAAWPLDLIAGPREAIAGFVMPRIGVHRDVHELYSPKSRQDAFPEADFRFLVHVAANVARAFAVVHDQGHVLGDVNHGNLLVGADGTVMLIDCDSFQIEAGGEIHTCDVGTSLFTPPELAGLDLWGLVRTPNHDLFGLAVLLFHLLFMGRHPFAGRYRGRGDMPIERAIAEHRFAYAADGTARCMEQPPGTLPLGAMGAAVAAGFERAFAPAGGSDGRPDAKSWVGVLDAMRADLRVCSEVGSHHYPGELSACPWCALEAATPIRLFGRQLSSDSDGISPEERALWRAIMQVRHPGPDPALPSEQSVEIPAIADGPADVASGIRMFASLGLAFGGLLSLFLASGGDAVIWLFALWSGAVVVWPRESRNARLREVEQTEGAWQDALADWRRQASAAVFDDKLNALEAIWRTIAGLGEERVRLLAVLAGRREGGQLQQFLDRARIEHAHIDLLLPSQVSMLASHGIKTAADVREMKLNRIRGMRPAQVDALMGWRKAQEQQFRFDPSRPIDPEAIHTLDRELRQRRQRLLKALQEGLQDLERLSTCIPAARQRLMPSLRQAWTDFCVAELRLPKR